MKKLFAVVALALATVLSGCTIIDTGEVGLRKNFDKTIEAAELPEGSMNQTFIGTVLEFPVRDVNVFIDNLPAVIAADNSTMKEVDFNIIYNINPSCVSDLYSKKSKSFHATNAEGDILLMNTYVYQVASNAIHKSIRQHDAMKANDNRQAIETEVVKQAAEKIAADGLNGCITLTAATARALTPSDALKTAADELVREKTINQKKVIEVQNATLEAQRIAALNANKGAIAYMDAQSRQMMAQAMLQGKVKTVVVPHDFKGDVHVSD